MILASSSYKIIIPPGSSILLQFNFLPSNILQLTFPFKALWGTPNYGIPGNIVIKQLDSYGMFNIPKNIIAKVKILAFNVSSTGTLCFSKDITKFLVADQWYVVVFKFHLEQCISLQKILKTMFIKSVFESYPKQKDLLF